ncbi:MAG: ROK family protein [Limosilactobacillus sp.]|uniref:ROK family protein n=1 Tax=Limosilactobacillus sp. TaxID=2773925 RepID=UPI0027103139|nr:ROK family protein [Limosilactobacillus sp.]
MPRHYLSIDIGGTNIKFALIDHSGNIIERDKVATPRNREEFLSALQQVVSRFLEIAAVCVSVPGIVHTGHGRVKFTGALGFMGQFELADYMKEISGKSVFVGNDGNCAALAEMWLGRLSGIDNGATITLGTSVGGGLVINGNLIEGTHFRAGELSAIVNNYNDAKATTGSNTSAVKMIEAVATRCQLPDLKDGRRAFGEINAGNPDALEIFQPFCRRVAILISNIQAVVDLERVLIGGGISVQPIVVEEVRRQFKALQESDRRIRDDIEMPEIMAAQFGNDANILGALYGYLLQTEYK